MSIGYCTPYLASDAPRIGVVFNSISAFVEAGKAHGEQAFSALLEECKREGVIAADSVVHPGRIFGAHDAWKVAEAFSGERLDAVVIFNSGFPCGHVLPILGLQPHLRHLPLIVAAYEEPNDPLGSCAWATNAVCGSDMNQHDARYMGRYVRYLTGAAGSPEFARELAMLMNVYRVVRKLSGLYLGRFGDAPGGFHSATADQLTFAKTFGVIVETVDLLRVYHVYQTLSAQGTAGAAAFTEDDIQATLAEMKQGRLVLITDEEALYRVARLYHALVALCQAEGFEAASLRCWPELMAEPLQVAGCLAIAWATAKRDVAAFACEGDWPGAMVQAIAGWLTGRPAAFLDFVDWTAKRDVVRFGHCGVGLCGCMAPNDPELMARVSREGGVSAELLEEIVAGKVRVNDALIGRPHTTEGAGRLIGQLEYGPKTGIDLIQNPDGSLQMLAFTGENSPETAQGILYSGCDLRIKNYRRLDEIKRTRGFSHHLVIALADILPELRELCQFYNVELLSPDE